MDLSYSPAERAFVAEVRDFLAPFRQVLQFLHNNDYGALRSVYQALGERNWLALSWPQALGGLGLPPTFEFILWDEMAYARIARPPLSAGIVAKTIIRYGDDEQKARWLPPIRTGKAMFSLGYSEPEAGSDLASARLVAERVGDVYRLNGVKIWSSGAHEADFLWLLCRTGEPASRSAGLSLVIVDLRSPSLRIRPMAKMGGNVFTEITFDNVEVPVAQRVGPENGAWTMMSASLADERHVQYPPKRVLRDFEEVRDWLRDHGRGDDPLVRHRLAELSIEVLKVQAHALSVLSATLQDRSAVVEAAANKRAYCDAAQRIARAAMELGCAEAVIEGEIPEALWRQSLEESIGGGGNEIMTGIIARQGLGLKP